MIRIYCEAADAVLKETQTLTAGMVNYPEVLLTFSSDWDGYGKAVVVKAGTVEKSALIVNNKFTVPSECLANSGVNLIVGISGSDGVHTIPTIWCSCGEIMDSYDPNDSSSTGTATPTLVEQMLGYAGDMEDLAEDLDSMAIRHVVAVDTNANRYGTVDVEVADTGAGDNRTITFTFANMKGNGIESLTFTESGENRGRVQVRLDDGTTTNYDGIKDALDQLGPEVKEFVDEWLEEHPEATTTIADKAVSYVKLDDYLEGKIDKIGDGNLLVTEGNLIDAVNAQHSSISSLNTAINGKMAAKPTGIELTPQSGATNGGYIDFHYAGSAVDFTSRIIESASGTLSVIGGMQLASPLPVASGGTGNNSVDTTPTQNSTKMITSGGVFSAINDAQTYKIGDSIPVNGQKYGLSNIYGNIIGITIPTVKKVPNGTLTLSGLPQWVRGNGNAYDLSFSPVPYSLRAISKSDDYNILIELDMTSATSPLEVMVALFNNKTITIS